MSAEHGITLYAANASADVTSRQSSVNITTPGAISGAVSARTSVGAFAAESVSGSVTATDGSISLSTLAGFQGDLSAGGSVTAFAAGSASGDIDAAHDIDLNVAGSYTGAATAGGRIDAFILGDLGGTLTGGQNGALIERGVSLTVAPRDASGGGNVNGDVTSVTAGVSINAAGDLTSNVSADTSATLNLGGAAASGSSVTAGQGVSIFAVGDIGGAIDAGGSVDASTAASFGNVTLTAGGNIYATARTDSTLTAEADGDIVLDLGNDAGSSHDVSADAGGKLDVSIFGSLSSGGSLLAGGDVTVFTLGALSASTIESSAGHADLTVGDGLDLSSLSGHSGVSASVLGLANVSTVTSAGGSIQLFAGGIMALGSASAADHLRLAGQRVTGSGQLQAGGDIDAVTVDAWSSNASAGRNLSVVADGIDSASLTADGDLYLLSTAHVTPASFHAGGDLTLAAVGNLLLAAATVDGDVRLLHTESTISGLLQVGGSVNRVEIHGSASSFYLDVADRIDDVWIGGNLLGPIFEADHIGRVVVLGDVSPGDAFDPNTGGFRNFRAASAIGSIETYGNFDAWVSVGDVAAETGTVHVIRAAGAVAGQIDAYAAVNLIEAGGAITATYPTERTGAAVGNSATVYDGRPGDGSTRRLTWAGDWSLDRVQATLDGLAAAVKAAGDEIGRAGVTLAEQATAVDARLDASAAEQAQALADAAAGLDQHTQASRAAAAVTADQASAGLARAFASLAVQSQAAGADARSSVGHIAADLDRLDADTDHDLAVASLSLTRFEARLSAARQAGLDARAERVSALTEAYQNEASHHDREVLYEAKSLYRYLLVERSRWLDDLQEKLEWASVAVSVVPILGTAASAVIDAGNAALYLSRGRLKDAAWSAAGILPFVTELRAGSRLGRALAHGAAEAATRVGRRAAKFGDDVVAIVRKAPHLACPTNSFAAGTQVVVGVAADGSLVTKSIEDVRVGDAVLTRPSDDPEAAATYEPVLGVSHRTVHELYEIEILGPDGGTEVLQVTAEHPFWVEGHRLDRCSRPAGR